MMSLRRLRFSTVRGSPGVGCRVWTRDKKMGRVRESLVPGIWPGQRLLLLFESPTKPLYLPAGIHQALLAGEERVTGGAEIYSQVRLGRARLPGVAAGAVNGGVD